MYAVDRLRDSGFNGYRRLVLPHALDRVVAAAVAEYVHGDEATRRGILDSLTPRGAEVLSVYGERAAALAVRSQSTDVLRDALVAVGMAHNRLEDHRTNVIVLAALSHSTELLGSTLAQLLDRETALIPPPALAILRRFAARDPRDRSLSAMGLRAQGEGTATFRYW